MTAPATPVDAAPRRPREAQGWRLLLDLFKLRIGVTIGATAAAGLAIAPASIEPLRGLALVLGVTLASAAAGAYNQYAERDLDRAMRRTRHRAFATGRLAPGPAWPIAIAAVALAGVGLAWYATNALAALHTALGAFTYGVVYTVWLKRRTAWNIVVGGAAGSFAVLAGAAAAGAATDGAVLAFAFAVFLWTPPHFWSLAIACRDDYAAAGVPMLPVVVGDVRAAQAVFWSAALLVAASFVPAFLGLSWLYALAALGGGTFLMVRAAQVALEPTRVRAWGSFRASLVQLSLLVAAACAEPLFHG